MATPPGNPDDTGYTYTMRFRDLPLRNGPQGAVMTPSPLERYEGTPGNMAQVRNWAMVEYGQGLSVHAIEARRNGTLWPVRPGGGDRGPNWNAGINVAVVEWVDDNGETQYLVRPSNGSNAHSEDQCFRSLANWGIPLDRIKALYTERMPCCNNSTNCAAMLEALIPGVPITFSAEFDQPLAAPPPAMPGEPAGQQGSRTDSEVSVDASLDSARRSQADQDSREASEARGNRMLRQDIRQQERRDQAPLDPLTDQDAESGDRDPSAVEARLDDQSRLAELQRMFASNPDALRILDALVNRDRPGAERLQQVREELGDYAYDRARLLLQSAGIRL